MSEEAVGLYVRVVPDHDGEPFSTSWHVVDTLNDRIRVAWIYEDREGGYGIMGATFGAGAWVPFWELVVALIEQTFLVMEWPERRD